MAKQPLGLLWTDPVKIKAEKRIPPARVWEAPDYLPGLEAAKKFDVRMLSNADLLTAKANGEQMICDIEIYHNYFLAAFMSMKTGKVIYFETQGVLTESSLAGISWMLHNFCIVTFNGNGFDLPLLAMALDGCACSEIKHACDMIIKLEMKPWQVLKSFKVKPLEIDHIDLIEVCPLQGSLKIYGGRVHCPRMQDLPFKPESILTEDQISIIRYYCVNDLTTTAFLNANLKEQIALRVNMSTKYGIDLRSKSDAQIAEAVIVQELYRITGVEAGRAELNPGEVHHYRMPDYLTFQTPELQALQADIAKARFVVSESGSILTPPELLDMVSTGKKSVSRTVQVGKGVYTVGIGGLHSNESKVTHRADSNFRILDRDVASYYPAIILNQGLFPSQMGRQFITIYRSIVERRLLAKKEKNNIEADTLKIVINGSFGKFGSHYSRLYSPQLLIQVTITGQLSLLMMIESLELAGIEVISANTDGVVSKFPRVMQETFDRIIAEWEARTSFVTEETEYVSLHSRDVNSYLSIKPDGKTKGKGRCAIGEGIFRFLNNPSNIICIEAAISYITKGIPLLSTITAGKDIRKFLTVQAVKGGAVKDGIYLGKAVRFYYATGAGGEIIYANTGNKVPKSDGARPCMELPKTLPDDVDFARYEREAFEILQEIGAV